MARDRAATLRLRNCLLVAGWSDGRVVDLHRFAERLAGRGFPAHPPAVAFFREYGGLRLEYRDNKSPLTTLDLTLERLPRTPLPSYIQRLQQQVGPLAPIAEEPESLYTFYIMDPSGRVYAYVDDPELEAYIWGPWPSAVAALSDWANQRKGPVLLGTGQCGPDVRAELRGGVQGLVSSSGDEILF